MARISITLKFPATAKPSMKSMEKLYATLQKVSQAASGGSSAGGSWGTGRRDPGAEVHATVRLPPGVAAAAPAKRVRERLAKVALPKGAKVKVQSLR